MSLLENAKKEAQVEGTVAPEATPKKKSNSEYQKRQRELAAKYGKQLKDFYGDKVPEEIKEAVAFFAREKKAAAGGSAFGKPVIYKLFGDTPKKGASITAMKVFEDTGKGFAEMRQLIKKWAKNNIVVKFDEGKKSYVLDSDVPAYQA
jgi:hypothetical protein